MAKWLKIGAALLLLAWAPFLYAELTSEPAEKKARELPSDELAEEPAAGEPLDTEGAGAEGDDEAAPIPAAKAPAEPAAEGPTPEAPDEAPAAAADEPAAEPAALDPAAPDPAEPGPAEEGEQEEGEAQEEEAPPPVASGPTAQLKHAFETEPRDALWAKDTERSVTAVFTAAEAPEGMLERVSCRRAVCRVDVRWSREHATKYVGAYEALHEQVGTEVAVEPVGEVDEDGRQNVHLYVLRKGYTAADLAR